MNSKFWKIFLRVAGIVTLLGPLPSMLAPIKGTLITLKIDLTDLPALVPVVGHWGIMIVGIGILIYLSASNIALRKTTLIYAILEKIYMVSGGAWLMMTAPEFGVNFIPVMIADTLQVIGFLVYFIQQYKTLGRIS
ncbi:hypothetical protein [Flammeovirga kamogawensis]|uniref:Uncharacterized protein n=1 Tax=Flammeovirga kamogawensis TaxID=373891 RepID=A0ABX8H553_9BACT|nr:hypothetical protein [Flammeovirga kamogawensis]MBB6461796.1 hypothetical protein [Flammeovirga kamogawensis]QWG10712.1 hypothetical protein KM029_25345 [Flammeovirga kamogawensis]TRX63814.1 hypothetical protein EO216_25715 [Flammeovirga kamogawensis]